MTAAEESQAPFVRLADRYALGFLLVSIIAAGGAWLLAGPGRAVAVLVVATPCPLILAAPAEVAETVGAVIGVDEVLAERRPAEKVAAVAVERRGGPVIMVGDGINDAPALALADAAHTSRPPRGARGLRGDR